MSGLRIAPLTAADEAAFRELWAQYLAYYKVELRPEVTDRTWARLIDPAAPLAGRLAWLGDRVVGFALHLHHPSTWVAGEDCYLEDLFVTEAARGHGAGRALIDDLIAIARSQGWHRLYWHTDIDNARARALYDSYTAHDNHVRYRMKL